MIPYWGGHGQTIYHGDCRSLLRDIPEGSIDLVFTSPPYDNARDGAYESVSLHDLVNVGSECLRITKPGGVFVCNIDGPVIDKARSLTPFMAIIAWSELSGWRHLDTLVYRRNGAPGAYHGRFRKDHEYMTVFVKDGPRHTCNKREIATKSKHIGHIGHLTSVRRKDGVLAKRRVSGWAAENNMTMPGTVWSYGSVGKHHDPSCDTGHPATFPEKLARDVLSVFSNPGDTVLDPFLGSGTTLRVARDIGRNGIGIELERKWCDVAAARIDKTEDTLF